MRRAILTVALGFLVAVAAACLGPTPWGPGKAWAAGCTPTSGQQNGVDVGSDQGPINYASVAGSGVKFVYARAGQGNYHTDQTYATNDTQAKAAGLAFGAYDVFDPTVDPTAQANYFLSGAHIAAGDLIPAVDVVGDGHGGPSDNGAGVTPAVFTSRLQTWLNVVQGALGVRPLLYADTSEWNTFTGSDTAFGMAGYPLWIAYTGANPSPPLPGGWTTWAFWQHSNSGSVPGISGAVDEDYFSGASNGGNLCTATVSGGQVAAPVKTMAPQISGTPTIGQTLFCSQGSWTNYPESFAYQWLRDGAPIDTATGADYTLTKADAGHQLSCQVTASNGAGSAMATSAAVIGSGGGSGGGTATPPRVTNATQSHARWRRGRHLATLTKKHKPPIGTSFSFALNEAASVSFAFTQKLGGRKANGKCVVPTKHNRRKLACKRTVVKGTLHFTAHTGTNRVFFQGWITASKKLALGRYTLVITAANAAGRSAPQSLSFTIVK